MLEPLLNQLMPCLTDIFCGSDMSTLRLVTWQRTNLFSFLECLVHCSVTALNFNSPYKFEIMSVKYLQIPFKVRARSSQEKRESVGSRQCRFCVIIYKLYQFVCRNIFKHIQGKINDR